MEPLSIVLIFVFGVLAGVVTGFLSASAAIVMTPLLSIGLGYETFTAIGISLATDVFASISSVIVYLKNKNVRVKEGLLFSFFALIGVLLGTLFSREVPDGFLALYVSCFIIFFGIQLTRKPLHKRLDEFNKKNKFEFLRKNRVFSTIFVGLIIGLICGAFGAGGGLMILFFLLFVYKYKIHVAIGTSVLMMSVIAFSGSVAHFFYTGIPYFEILIGGLGGIVGGVLTSIYANRIDEEKLSKIIGVIILCLGILFVLKWIINFF